jgi:hypothetical protein
MTTISPSGSAQATAADWRSSVARIGLVGKALLYAMFGLLAIDVATGGSGSSSTAGAIERVAGGSTGQVLLIGLCIGLAALVAWKALQAIAGDPVEGSDTSDRAKFAAKGVVYAGALVAAVSVLIANWNGGSSSSGSSSGGSTESEATATVLDWPAGQVLVIAAGFGIMAFGLYELYQHTVRATFMERLDVGGRPESAQHAVEVAGRAGYGASGFTTVVIGVFFVIAGVNHDPNEATGLSGALQELGDTGWGQWLLWLVGLGLLGYAAFSLVEAALRRST